MPIATGLFCHMNRPLLPCEQVSFDTLAHTSATPKPFAHAQSQTPSPTHIGAMPRRIAHPSTRACACTAHEHARQRASAGVGTCGLVVRSFAWPRLFALQIGLCSERGTSTKLRATWPYCLASPKRRAGLPTARVLRVCWPRGLRPQRDRRAIALQGGGDGANSRQRGRCCRTQQLFGTKSCAA